MITTIAERFYATVAEQSSDETALMELDKTLDGDTPLWSHERMFSGCGTMLVKFPDNSAALIHIDTTTHFGVIAMWSY